MKTFKLLLPFLFLINSYAFSQCDVFYLLSTHGLACDQDQTGEICFTTNANYSFNPFDPCATHSYRYELEFNRGWFNYLDLNDFSLQYQDQNIVILSSPISIVSDGDIINCLRGVIINPNILFTVRVIDETTNTLLSTSYFSFINNYTDVGTQNSTTNLSDAIAVQSMLSQNDAPTHSQKLKIHGTLVIDVNYEMGVSTNSNLIELNNIVMDQDASIIVNPGIEFIIQFADIYGCKDAWSNIQVNDGSTLHLNHVTIMS